MPETRTERNFKIYGGTFINDNRSSGYPHLRVNSGSSHLPIVNEDAIHLIKELVCAPNYRKHAAQLDGRAVVVKVFSGPRAQEDREETEVSSRNLMHPNFLRMMGCSPELSPEPFAIYHGSATVPSLQFCPPVIR
ncbi:hypothetical protein C8J57DRAFT_1471762 [Mycena rebaudengoi]|nr:hypothetical protein C8J57DRAFT_1471762 [Mycena rebaudengoi]